MFSWWMGVVSYCWDADWTGHGLVGSALNIQEAADTDVLLMISSLFLDV